MCNEELMIKIVNQLKNEYEYIDCQKTKNIIGRILYDYEVKPNVTALVPSNNMADKVMLYFASKKLDGLSEKTLNNYKRYILKFCFMIQKNLEDINSMDIRMYLSECSNNGIKNSTLSTIISILKSFFNWLENEDYIVKSPMRKIKTTKTEKRIRKALTQEELELLRDVCQTEREKALIEFFFSTGCRLDEVYKLNKEDINWSDGSTLVVGKGNVERPVYLNAKAKVYLKKYLNTRKDNNSALFASERQPHDRLGVRGIQKIFTSLGVRSGLNKSIHPHLLRHTTATAMLQNGASLTEVQSILGHSSPATSQIYAHLNKEAVQMSHRRHVV